ncbi:CheR family methyltransferase [Pirellulaceae bacterium SH449]
MKEPERLTLPQFELFKRCIYDRCGIRLDIAKITLITNRLKRRLQATDCRDFSAYYKLITSKVGAGELVEFVDALTTNETSFFRTASHFEWFKNDFLSEIVREKSLGKRRPTLRIWSAACSSGEEPYSLAMCLAESSLILRGWEIRILGSDISESSLRKAREAIYSERTMQELGQDRIRRHFTEDSAGKYKLRPSIASKVEFQTHNLMNRIAEQPFDCIWLRNVLIYFDKESKAKVIENLVEALVSGGYLVVGPSEGVYEMLGMLQRRSTFLYQKP